MLKYFTIAKVSFMGALVHRFHYFAMLMANIAYIIMIYFVWKAIYSSGVNIGNGLAFQDTFVYLAISSSLYYIFQSWIEYDLSTMMIDGSMAVHLARPYDLHFYWIFRIIGFALCKFITLGIGSVILVSIMIQENIFASVNLVSIVVSIIFAFLISVNLDYIAGIIVFYTHSVWGANLVKETLLLLLSGLSVPLVFYPKMIRNVLLLLPFSCVYNTPMTLLTSSDLSLEKIVNLISIQAFWALAMTLFANLLYKRCISHSIIYGG